VRVTGYLTAEFRYTTVPDWTIRDRSITWVLGIRQVPSCSATGFLISTNILCTVRGGFAPHSSNKLLCKMINLILQMMKIQIEIIVICQKNINIFFAGDVIMTSLTSSRKTKIYFSNNM